MLPLRDVNSSKTYLTGNTYKTKSSGVITIIGQVDHTDKRGQYTRFRVQFADGNTEDVFPANIKTGEVKNYFHKSVYGIGCLGKGKHKPSRTVKGKVVHSREYVLWNAILRRCYSEESLAKRPSYEKVTVDTRWFNFQNFCEDLPFIECYDLWMKNSERYDLDKDLKQIGITEKVYSKDTCKFVTASENGKAVHIK